MQQDKNENTFRKIRVELPELFTKNAYPPLEVSTDGLLTLKELITIKIDSLFQVSSLTIQGVDLKPEVVNLLEQALVKAINKAFQEVAKRNAERLVQSIGKSVT
jgi:hypothetical protein